MPLYFSAHATACLTKEAIRQLMKAGVARTCSPRSAVLQVAPTKSRGPKEQVRAGARHES
jgi:hypothetical protein